MGTDRDPAIVRELTDGERAIAASVFGDALDCDKVLLRRAKWFMFQPAWVTMAPDGDIWFHPNGGVWCGDFAARGLGFRTHLVHELTHVWQRQQGINLILSRRPFAPYRYLPLIPGKPFTAYGIEQQASIVEDSYWLREGGDIIGAPPLADYEALLPFKPAPAGAVTANAGHERSPWPYRAS